jgi:hypothetical protein
MDEAFSAEVSGKSVWWGIGIALLLDAPLIALLIFSGGIPNTIAFGIILFPLIITGLLIYITIAARKMSYILKEDVLYIDFSVSPLSLPYNKIIAAGKVETQLIFRIFGGSWPGVHWGMFSTKNIGNVQAYLTDYKGEFIQLEVSDGTRVLLSPKEPDVFLEALKKRVDFVSPLSSKYATSKEDRRITYIQVAVVALAWLILTTFVAVIYPSLPEIIPVHFGFDGKPNRWGNKIELLILVGIAALFPALNTLFTLKFGRYNRRLSIFLTTAFLLVMGLFWFVVNIMISAI